MLKSSMHQITPSPSANFALSKPPEIMATQPMNMNGNLFSDLGRLPSTTNRMPMNQMHNTFPAPAFNPTQSGGSNQMGNFLSMNTLNPIQSTAKKNGQDAAVALSAQEINDFLS